MADDFIPLDVRLAAEVNRLKNENTRLMMVVSSITREQEVLTAEVWALRAVKTGLRAALKDAIEGMEGMLPYIDEYFAAKWSLADYLKRAQQAHDDNP